MLVEIGSITSLDIGQEIYETLSDDDEIELMFLEKGRSDAPFVEKQFGEFGESAVITLIVKEEKQESVSGKICEIVGFDQAEKGIILVNKKITEKPDFLKT